VDAVSATPLSLSLPDEVLDEIARRVADILEARRLAKPADAKRWLTVSEAASYIGAKPQRIYDLRSTGRLSRCGDGRRGLVDRRELDDLVQGGA
jgi:excisionase family DNA binding protein